MNEVIKGLWRLYATSYRLHGTHLLYLIPVVHFSQCFLQEWWITFANLKMTIDIAILAVEFLMVEGCSLL